MLIFMQKNQLQPQRFSEDIANISKIIILSKLGMSGYQAFFQALFYNR